MIDQGDDYKGEYLLWGACVENNKKRRLYRGQPPFMEDFMRKSHNTRLDGGQRWRV